MKPSEKLMAEIGSLYGRGIPYSEFAALHAEIISRYEKLWIPFSISRPEVGSHVFCIEDLACIGKPKFIGDYFYTHHGFVSEPDYDDGYGYITHWFYFSTVDVL